MNAIYFIRARCYGRMARLEWSADLYWTRHSSRSRQGLRLVLYGWSRRLLPVGIDDKVDAERERSLLDEVPLTVRSGKI